MDQEIFNQMVSTLQDLCKYFGKHVTVANSPEEYIITITDSNDIKESFKYVVEFFRSLIEKLDDDIFLEVSEILGSKIDLKELDTLINKTDLTDKEYSKLVKMINIADEIIKEAISNKIIKLYNIYVQI